MDYRRIYHSFIESRRDLKPDIFEAHHILPRSLGGTDDAANLVNLSPEDHFFAHLLLAKIYGGTLWVPVIMWLGGSRRNWRGKRSRLNYGWAARAYRGALSGKGAHQYDRAIYVLHHLDGRTFAGTQAQMASLGMSKAGANLLVKGKCASMRGWYFPDNKPEFVGRGSRKGSSHPMAISTAHHFRHRDGREFVGSQYEMHIIHGLSKSGVCTLVSGKRSISKGWYVVGREPTTRGRAGAYKAEAQSATC